MTHGVELNTIYPTCGGLSTLYVDVVINLRESHQSHPLHMTNLYGITYQSTQRSTAHVKPFFYLGASSAV